MEMIKKGGSLILEIEANRLDGKWLSQDGIVLDNFTIMKEVNKVTTKEIISGESVNMDASWIGQYNWSSGQTSRSLTITPQASSTYTVTDPFQCITDTFNVNVTVSINISSIGITQTCVGAEVDVSFITTGIFYEGNIFTLQLSSAAGSFIAPIDIGTLLSTAAGTISGVIPINTSVGSNYQLRIISSVPQGISSPSASFAINALPALPLVSDISYCQNTTAVALTATPLSGHTAQWYGTNATGGSASAIAPTPSTNTLGSIKYYVSQKNATTGCEGARAAITVTIKSTPKPVITTSGLGSGNVVLSSSTTTGNQWFKNGSAIGNATSQTYSVLTDGVYHVQATLDGCISELSDPMTVIVTSVIDSGRPIRLDLFPVPSHQAVSIQLFGVKEDEVSEAVVFDMAGRVIHKQKIRGKEGTLSLEQYATGDYFLRIIGKSFLLQSKFIKD